MKEINSLFKKPEQYIVTAILSLGSFAACFYGLTEQGFVSAELRSVIVFRAIVFVFIIVPALFPFHHLMVSGRNTPAHLLYPLSALSLLAITFFYLPDFILEYKWLPLVSCAIWAGLLLAYHKVGIAFRNSARKEVWIKENVFIEGLVIASILLVMLALGFHNLFSFSWLKNHHIVEIRDELKPGDFDCAFEYKDHAHALKLQINDSVFKNRIPEEIYHHNRGAYFYVSIGNRKPNRERFLLHTQYLENEQLFAERFEQIIKRYQAVGTILLALAGLAILVLLYFELGHREYRNRLRIQLFMILTLMIPLNKTIRKEDITIAKPFGDTVFNRKNIISTPKDKPPMDTTGLAREATIKDLPRHIDTIMTSLLNDINYVNYVLSINDIKTRRIDSLYPGKPDTLRRSKPRP